MSGRDRDHPIQLDEEEIIYPGRRRRSKERSHKREATIDLKELSPPQPTYNRPAPPAARETHNVNEHSPRHRHRKKHREDRHGLGLQSATNQNQEQQDELARRQSDREAELFQPQWQAELPIGSYQAVNPTLQPQMPDLRLGEDHDLDEEFWGQYLMNEPPFPEGDVDDLWGDLFIAPENFNPAAPMDPRLAPQAPNLNLIQPYDVDEYLDDDGLSDSSLEDEGDVQIVRERTVPVDDQAQEDACLAKILELFPDICKDHVRKLFQERKEQDLNYSAFRDNRQNYDPSELLVLKILESSYPKQKKDTKRKRSLGSNGSSPTENEKENWGAFESDGDKLYLKSAGTILQEEFPLVPHSFVKQQLADKKSLYGAYLAIAEIEGPFGSRTTRPYQHLKSPRKSKFFSAEGEDMVQKEYYGYGPKEVLRELAAARAAWLKKEATLRAQKDAEEAEALNEREHIDAGAMMECKCCFSDAPINRTIYCDGEDPHFFCFDCARNHASNEMGKMRYQLKCMDGSICTGVFSNPQLRHCLDKKTLAALERLQQQEEIRLAGFEDLAECPFCDYKAIYPPVEIDKEFRCGNPECERVTCRLCNEETHIPKSCEENKKERHLPARHAIEEAMTEALIRTCPTCKAQIVKETGCNKMTCTRCFKMMCYICRKDISGEQYNHFNKSKCEVYDNNTDKLHNDAVAAAEKAALEKAKKDNPGIPAEELKIKMNEAVIKAANRPPFQPLQIPIPGLPDAQQVQEYMRGIGLPGPPRNGGGMWQHVNDFNDFVAQRGGYVANQREAMGAHQPAGFGRPAMDGAPGQPGQPYPDFVLQATAMQNPPPPRGRFPVVPHIPGGFGNVLHHHQLDPIAGHLNPQAQAFHPDPAVQPRAQQLHANLPAAGARAPPTLANLDRAGLLDDMALRGRRDEGLRRVNTERTPRRKTAYP